MKKRSPLLKDKSIIWAVSLLAAVIILLGYNQFTGAASPATSMMGVYSGTSTTNTNNTTDTKTKYECSYCTTTDTCQWYTSETKCSPRCQGPQDCNKSSGGGDHSGGGNTTPPSPTPKTPALKPCCYCKGTECVTCKSTSYSTCNCQAGAPAGQYSCGNPGGIAPQPGTNGPGDLPSKGPDSGNATPELPTPLSNPAPQGFWAHLWSVVMSWFGR